MIIWPPRSVRCTLLTLSHPTFPSFFVGKHILRPKYLSSAQELRCKKMTAEDPNEQLLDVGEGGVEKEKKAHFVMDMANERYSDKLCLARGEI